ncbi:IS3 family transposase [Bacillus thuringiensis]|uniref:IS3 family transposase n=1 Tax=Bacillus thuringiensis TaxID=1428 RepID=UPI003C12C79F
MKRFNRPDSNSELKERIQAIYDEHGGCYGYRRMKELGLKCLVRIKNIALTKEQLGKLRRIF